MIIILCNAYKIDVADYMIYNMITKPHNSINLLSH